MQNDEKCPKTSGRVRKMLDGVGKGAAVIALAGALGVAGSGVAFADPVTTYWSDPTGPATIDPNLLTTYGVRAGSAGPDFLGITNTNFDFRSGPATSLVQYTDYTVDDLRSVNGSGLAIWATSVNQNANPYYQNLYYNKITGSTATQATTWMSNPVNAWGDSNGSASNKGNVSTGAATIAGLEFDPDIIFGANKYTNWANAAADGLNSETNIYDGIDYSPDPVFTSNDATNIWGQVFTMGRLATVADGLTDGTDKYTRYDNSDATTSAENYEKAIKGNLLYVASQIDDTNNNVSKKTVAYLYAIEGDTAYFFTPTAEGLLNGNDTGQATNNSVTNPNGNYAANNSTINMGYMATLPFITNTFNSGNATSGTIMGVEDIYKVNPTCTVGASDSATILANVDVIIYNSTIATNLTGTTGGRNSSGIGASNTPLTEASVRAWANSHDVNHPNDIAIIAGDDFGTSSNQGIGTVDTTTSGMAPLLYCQRNYTADKNARAAWAFSKVYPELYDNNADATYAYWVDEIYHVNTADVPTVVKYMTNQSDTVTYDASVAASLETKFQTGRTWWATTGSTDAEWSGYAYYNGSSRASYYSGNAGSAETLNTIGIFAPNLLW